ncbi:hypothetical protein RQM47_05500 [Rubrivirga sp. S365]|uniref:hypothetical protein n=1 Tax=Rubrivirga sp. S365 TaxID=3076080 RepID=UPI0028C5DA9D|nr:hypothetical protein [Rubrivirga sp. S365]MDT7856088.1 hypothetical protein [Rubrivirga sp. S365]
MSHRTYDQHEIARVIERAAELQEAAADRSRCAEPRGRGGPHAVAGPRVGRR